MPSFFMLLQTIRDCRILEQKGVEWKDKSGLFQLLFFVTLAIVSIGHDDIVLIKFITEIWEWVTLQPSILRN